MGVLGLVLQWSCPTVLDQSYPGMYGPLKFFICRTEDWDWDWTDLNMEDWDWD